ncbi:MAG: hypothetical protein U0235_17970 [Polyangiaceae bacterium]
MAVLTEARLAQASSDRERASNALRAYGAALADLAGDLRGAAQAFVVAARIVPERGPRFIAADLRARRRRRGAHRDPRRARDRERPATAGVLAEEGSRAALGASQPGRTFALAKLALEMLPDHTDAFEMAELGAATDGRPADVSPATKAWRAARSASSGVARLTSAPRGTSSAKSLPRPSPCE